MKRTRTHPAVIIAYELYLYFSSRIFRLAAHCLSSSVIERTHVSIWKWVQKYSKLVADRFRVDRRLIRWIFVDENLIKVDGQNYWLWIAYEPKLNTTCLMMLHLSRERTIFFVCYQFFKQLRTKFGRKPIYTDGGR
jgi:transposase-like protein